MTTACSPLQPQDRVAIIIPTLNEAANIRRLLSKLDCDLEREFCEIILVDGGSTDSTVLLARDFADKLLVTAPGRSHQMNAGAQAAAATCNILLFLHADTRLPPDGVGAIRAAVGQGAAWGAFSLRLSSDRWPYRVIEWAANRRAQLTHVITGDQVLFSRADIFWQVGGYPQLALMEDIALSHRLRKLSRPYFLPQKVVSSSRRWEQYGVAKTILLMWALRIAFWCGRSTEHLARYYPGDRPAP